MNENSTRQKTNSITHLVKIVAREEIDDSLTQYDKLIRKHIDKTVESLKNMTLIMSSLKNAGNIWTEDEDNLLIKEVEIAISQIAQNHGRTKGGILARIYQKEIIK